jgi:excisionase family DNA binding protein
MSLAEVRRVNPARGQALLDYRQLSEWLNDTIRHVRRLVEEDRIPYIKVGHFVRFDPQDIAEWLNANRRGAS